MPGNCGRGTLLKEFCLFKPHRKRAIFISYRRDDSEGHAGRLYGDLARKFGDRSIFMDVVIGPGLDFRKVINDKVSSCGVLLALIGPTWLDAKDESGQRRLDNPRILSVSKRLPR